MELDEQGRTALLEELDLLLSALRRGVDPGGPGTSEIQTEGILGEPETLYQEGVGGGKVGMREQLLTEWPELREALQVGGAAE